MTNFVGIGAYIDQVVPEAALDLRNRVVEDSLLHEVGDLLGQACGHAAQGRPAAAASIVAEATRRAEALRLRLSAADAALAAVREQLGVADPEPRPARKKTAAPES